MKISNNFKTISKAFIATLVLSVALVACSKNESEPIQAAGLAVINASPSATLEYDFIVDNTKANPTSFKYDTVTKYLALYPGLRSISITKRNETQFLLTKQEIFQAGKAYSVFLADTGSRRTFVKVDDDLTAPETDKAKVRFVNLSPDAPALNLGITGATDNLFTNKAFKESTAFVSVTPGTSVSFEIKDNATNTVKATLANVKIEKGGVYTIWAKGFYNTQAVEALKLGAGIYTNDINK